MAHPIRTTREQKVDKAYRRVMATSASGLVTVAFAGLWLIGFVSFFTVVLLGVITVLLGMLTKRSVS